ncbi:Nif3-like dinuclear metal center hexameric protein [Lactobacillus sp. YT155]|uniref:Nif3-like dinuclear metal center hexameric protein n=1 Tax=Lactobacillus sp. YT155 TaxID=3060955 RepID=UPI00265F53B0|nr:Nif3-like dinuclear metal center hexameric protein [Lactobacillus sp. YT155]MDO1605453.1 Nif3-like dinuclear metal center hexameric protein [Lactobacillus sp. YT155]
MTKVQEIVDEIEKFAPLDLRIDDDPTGFQLGNRHQEVKKVMTTLDVRPNVVAEAIENNVDLIIAHHPVIFRPIKNLNVDDPQNKMYYDLIQNNITVYAAHTNLDRVNGGMNDWLANALALKNIIHPQELSLGVIGEVDSTTLDEFSKKVKNVFSLPGLRFIRPYQERPVHKVAIIGGDGGSFYPEILQCDVDTFITGDIYYHTAHDFQALNLNAIDPGHHIEAIFIQKMAEQLDSWSEKNDWKIDIIQSTANTEPYTFN